MHSDGDERTLGTDQLADPELIPVRMINEFVYCPRLFWIEYVDREFLASQDTLDGDRVHKRVDFPSGALAPKGNESADQSQNAEARSVSLSSLTLGIAGVLDIVHASDGRVIPTDYKRGTMPRIDGGVYDPERVQVILQALLLREHGYECHEARVYYAASRKHVTVTVDDEAAQLAVDAVAGAVRLLKQNHIPAPLVNSPKCGRCSLASICLPDEINALNSEVGDSTIRPFLAPRDEKQPLYVMATGSSLGLTGETISIKHEKKIIDELPLRSVSNITLIGNIQASTQLTRAALDVDIPIFYFSYGARLVGYALPAGGHSVDLRIAQHRVAAAEAEGLIAIAREFVAGKVKNQRTLVRRHLPEAHAILKRMALIGRKIETASSTGALLGLEGTAAADYFTAFRDMLGGKSSFDFHERNRRPPKDPVNALLSFAYALLTKECVAALHMVGFEPALGFYHKQRPGRPSLALDLMEEFRPLIADSVVLTVLNTGELEPHNFIRAGVGVSLAEKGRKAFLQAFERRLNSEILHPLFGYRASYRRIIYLQARLLARAVQGDIPRYTAFTVR